jgi:threonine/homoserine/homoserine lactone efflux protein
MDPSLVATYLSVTFLLVITPGATTTTVVRNSVARGFRAGAATAAGAAAGNSSHATVAGLGLAVLFQRLPGFVPAITTAGAIYMAWLGLGSLSKAWVADQTFASRVAAVSTIGTRSAFRDGFLVNLLNPPIITFYLMLPAFLPKDAAPWMYITLATIHVTMAFVCHLGWALAFGRLRERLQQPAATRALNAGAGLALLLLAVQSVIRVW